MTKICEFCDKIYPDDMKYCPSCNKAIKLVPLSKEIINEYVKKAIEKM